MIEPLYRKGVIFMMKMFRGKQLALVLTFILLIAFSATAGAASKINEDGYYKGIRLAGRVRIVESFADIKVQVVNFSRSARQSRQLVPR
jgi:hypothetical protein